MGMKVNMIIAKKRGRIAYCKARVANRVLPASITYAKLKDAAFFSSLVTIPDPVAMPAYIVTNISHATENVAKT
jgi:hypothetical protein